MPTFKITATMITTRVLTKSVDATTLEQATARLLLESSSMDWVITKKLTTASK